MEAGQALIEVLARLTVTRSRAELGEVVQDLVGPFGFTHFAIGSFNGAPEELRGTASARDPFLLNTWPRAWLEAYARQGIAHDDPIIAEALRIPEPFTWSELRARQPGKGAALYSAAADYGWRDGFAVPIADPETLSVTIGLASFAAPRLANFDAAARAEVISVGRAAFWHARTLAATEPPGEILTPRERQALRLVADGLSDAEVGGRLGVSRTTAHFHVEQAKKKLGSVSRTQAVARAIFLGLI